VLVKIESDPRASMGHVTPSANGVFFKKTSDTQSHKDQSPDQRGFDQVE
jgi:hypothetical protein